MRIALTASSNEIKWLQDTLCFTGSNVPEESPDKHRSYTVIWRIRCFPRETTVSTVSRIRKGYGKRRVGENLRVFDVLMTITE
jgi:hypothetical protein